MIDTEEFHKTLLDALEAIRDEYTDLGDPGAQRTLLLETCRNAAPHDEHIVGDNLCRILDHYIRMDAIDYDWVIGFLLTRVNNEVDRKMSKRERADDFDSRYNTVTSMILSQYELPDEMSVERYEHSNRYNPSPIASVKMALDKLPEYDMRYEDFVFIDIGSGMGRNLLLASEYPWARITGVELSAYLHEIAEANIAKYRSPDMLCAHLGLECVNATEFGFPDKNMVLYFWLPFDEEIASLFLQRLEVFLREKTLRCILVFLEVSYACLATSAVFKEIDRFLTPATTISENDFFSITVFSND